MALIISDREGLDLCQVSRFRCKETQTQRQEPGQGLREVIISP